MRIPFGRINVTKCEGSTTDHLLATFSANIGPGKVKNIRAKARKIFFPMNQKRHSVDQIIARLSLFRISENAICPDQ